MNDLGDFYKNAVLDGLCSEYNKKWQGCLSKKELIDLALEAKGLDYMGDSIAKGWGISPMVIHSKFEKYNNGKYVYDNGKYSSKMYCMCNDQIIADTTAVLVINCNAKVIIPKNSICSIYVTGNSNISILGEGEAIIISYGENTVKDIGVFKYRIINKKNKDEHE